MDLFTMRRIETRCREELSTFQTMVASFKLEMQIGEDRLLAQAYSLGGLHYALFDPRHAAWFLDDGDKLTKHQFLGQAIGNILPHIEN